MLVIKKYIILSICIFISLYSNAQQQVQTNTQKSKFWEQVSFGGGLGLAFTNGYTNISLSPTAIYQFNEQFALGVGLSGTYAKRRNYYTATIFGGSIISLYNPIDALQLSAEFEENSVNIKPIGAPSDNYSYPSLYLGLGYTIGNFGAVGVKYDILYDETTSIYGSAIVPFVRVFF